MRTRSQSTTVAASDVNWTRADGLTGTIVGMNPPYYDYKSVITDISDKRKHAFKACTHMSYNAVTAPFDSIDDDPANPALWVHYPGRRGFHYGQHLPSVGSTPDDYIPVNPRSSDDLGLCVFNAYNQFVTGITALDASQSIAEAGETPHLFNIWQRRRNLSQKIPYGIATNLTNGFLNYSFGWRPVISDLRAISKELRQFPTTVRKRLKRIGDGLVTRHFTYTLSDTISTSGGVYSSIGTIPARGSNYRAWDVLSGSRERKVVVTIRARVKPKLTGQGQDLLNKLGTLGLLPNLATIWAVTRFSFVVDWFYNIGGAIENLQGSLTHDISDVEVCVTDTRKRTLRYLFESDSVFATGPERVVLPVGYEYQRCFNRFIATPASRYVPQLTAPRHVMQYVLLGLLATTQTSRGRQLLRSADRYENLLDRRLDRLQSKIGLAISRRLGGFQYH